MGIPAEALRESESVLMHLQRRSETMMNAVRDEGRGGAGSR